ncbi:FusB/FusC family EF-G-binding protein [Alteribacillus sp. HJP-4]|uniref:FusB/FusC family EF-G-binding protein n=1 Tax=Alteribacillus sp. HJP-4 TaxID=2775394 RepID=UPI0035CCF3DC
MTAPFIQNHHLNVIKQKSIHIQNSFSDVKDDEVLQIVKSQAAEDIKQTFPTLNENENKVIDGISNVRSSIEVEAFIGSIYPYVKHFPEIGETSLYHLFPYTKKLTYPDLVAIDFSRLTYLGWNDIAKHRKYIVYELDGELVGLEGRYTPVNRHHHCVFCRQSAKTALVSFRTNEYSSENPDYYRSIGHYMCVDSSDCNRHITDVSHLDSFIRSILTPKKG